MNRSRLVSALTFGASATLLALALMIESASTDDMWVMLAVAIPAVLIGGLAGPRVAEARTAWVAALWGAGVTFVSISLYIAAVGLWMVLRLDDGVTINRVSWSLLAFMAIIGTVAASPLGALAGVLTRRWSRT